MQERPGSVRSRTLSSRAWKPGEKYAARSFGRVDRISAGLQLRTRL